MTSEDALTRIQQRREWACRESDGKYYTRGLLLTTLDDADVLAAAVRAQQAELAELKARTCDTCRYQWPRESGVDLCGKASIYGHSVAQVSCQQLGFTCGAWAAREGQK